jgi:hypothetical protein
MHRGPAWPQTMMRREKSAPEKTLRKLSRWLPRARGKSAAEGVKSPGL